MCSPESEYPHQCQQNFCLKLHRQGFHNPSFRLTVGELQHTEIGNKVNGRKSNQSLSTQKLNTHWRQIQYQTMKKQGKTQPKTEDNFKTNLYRS